MVVKLSVSFFFTSKMSKFTNFTEAFGELRAQKFRRKDRQICIWVDCKFEKVSQKSINPRWVILRIKLCPKFKSYSLVLWGDLIGGEMTVNPQRWARTPHRVPLALAKLKMKNALHRKKPPPALSALIHWNVLWGYVEATTESARSMRRTHLPLAAMSILAALGCLPC